MRKSKEETLVEDTVSALFDLAEDFEKRIKQIDGILTYAFYSGFILLMVDIGFILSLLFAGDYDQLIIPIVLLVIFILVVVYSRKNRNFLYYFELRFDTLKKARNWNPDPEIPVGNTPTKRYLEYLKVQDKRFAKFFEKNRGILQTPASLKGKSKTMHDFNGYFFNKEDVEDNIYQLFIKEFNRKVETQDIKNIKKEVEDVINKVKFPASHVVVIQTAGDISDDIIEFIDEEWILFPTNSMPGEEEHACPIEVIAETSKGTYDFGIIYFG